MSVAGGGLSGGGDGGKAELQLTGSLEGLTLLVAAGLYDSADEVFDADGAARIQSLVNCDVVAFLIDLGLDAGYLIGGLADAVGFEVLGLLAPLKSGVGVLDHVVVVAQLTLGEEGLRGVNGTAGDVHLVLRAVDAAEHDLAVRVGNNCGDGRVDLRVVIGRGISADNDAHAELVFSLGGAAAGGHAEHHAYKDDCSNKFFSYCSPQFSRCT